LKTIRKLSITYKLFGILFIGTAVSLFISFVLVWTGFQSYYTNHQLRSLEESFNHQYGLFFTTETLSIEDIYEHIADFELEQNAVAVVLEMGQADFGKINYEVFHRPQRPVSEEELNFISDLANDRLIRKIIVRHREQENIASFAEEIEGHPVHFLSTPIRGDSNRFLLLAVPDDSAVEITGVIRRYFGMVLGLALLVSLIIAYLVSRIITRPIKKIKGITTRIAALDFSEKIHYPGRDEMGQLAASVNLLADRLDEALARLKRDLKDKNEFLGAVSHELKTPLSLIEGFAEMIEELPLSIDQRNEYASMIREEAEKMDRVVSELLQYTRLSSGQMQLEKSTFPASGLIKEVMGRLRPLAAEKQIQLILHPADEPIQLHADTRRVDQLLTNLLTNAIRHAPSGGKVEIGISAKDGNTLLYVRNDGEPIPASEIERIWEPFVRVEKSRSRDTGGTGIGLSIVKNIVHLHGGSCQAENVNGGVRFHVILPP